MVDHLKKIGLVVAIVFAFICDGFCQPVFNILDSNSVGSLTVIQEDTGRFVVTSHLYNSYPNNFAVGLTRYNSYGNIIAFDTISVTGISTATGRLLDSETGGFYVANVIDTIDTIPPYNTNNFDFQLSYYSDIGSLVWSNWFGGLAYDGVTDIMRAHDGGILFVGNTKQNQWWSTQIYLAKFDVLGNLEWEQFYGPINNGDDTQWGNNIVRTHDGNYLLSARRWYGQPIFDYQAVIYKIDTIGNIIWEREYGNAQYHNTAPVITPLFDHTFIINTSKDPYFNSSWTALGSVSKIDGNGDLLWTKEIDYFGTTFHLSSKILENSDGTLMLPGQVQDVVNSDTQGWLLKLDPFGDTIWTKVYYQNDSSFHNVIYDMEHTSDGGYIMVGTDYTQGGSQKSWIFKTDCNGAENTLYPTGQPCDYYDCTLYPIDAYFSVSDTIIDLALNDSAIFNNPSNNATSRVWNFGDGNIDYTDSVISHIYTQTGIYEVQLIVFHGMCSDTVTQTVYVINTVGNNELTLNSEILVYPNPSTGLIMVAMKESTASLEGIKVLDVTGRIIYASGAGNDQKIEIDKAGLYYVVVETTVGSDVKRVVVE